MLLLSSILLLIGALGFNEAEPLRRVYEFESAEDLAPGVVDELISTKCDPSVTDPSYELLRAFALYMNPSVKNKPDLRKGLLSGKRSNSQRKTLRRKSKLNNRRQYPTTYMPPYLTQQQTEPRVPEDPSSQLPSTNTNPGFARIPKPGEGGSQTQIEEIFDDDDEDYYMEPDFLYLDDADDDYYNSVDTNYNYNLNVISRRNAENAAKAKTKAAAKRRSRGGKSRKNWSRSMH